MTIVIDGVKMSEAAANAVDGAGPSVEDDVRRVRAREITLDALLAQCLDGCDDAVDPDSLVAGWREYVDAIADHIGIEWSCGEWVIDAWKAYSGPSWTAYFAGLVDGLAWDLDGYASADAVRASKEGWDEATINAIGATMAASKWLPNESDPEAVEDDPDAWSDVCAAYNRGAYEGATRPQEERTGKAAGFDYNE